MDALYNKVKIFEYYLYYLYKVLIIINNNAI